VPRPKGTKSRARFRSACTAPALAATC
jgi:hypothetical protein